jgi:hypothetical protein
MEVRNRLHLLEWKERKRGNTEENQRLKISKYPTPRAKLIICFFKNFQFCMNESYKCRSYWDFSYNYLVCEMQLMPAHMSAESNQPVTNGPGTILAILLKQSFLLAPMERTGQLCYWSHISE